MTISIAVIDDQALMRDGFTMILNAQEDLHVVGDAEDGQAGIELCRKTNADVALMDVRMPRMDGIEATRIICEDPTITTKVLMLTTFDLDEYVYSAVRAGASGFLLKDTPAKELADAVRIIAEGNALLAPSVTKRLIEEFAKSPKPTDRLVSLPAELTDREHEALQLLARGMSNREIAAEMFVGEATAKTHVSRLLTKLGVRDRVQAVVMAYESGIVQPGSRHTTWIGVGVVRIHSLRSRMLSEPYWSTVPESSGETRPTLRRPLPGRVVPWLRRPGRRRSRSCLRTSPRCGRRARGSRRGPRRSSRSRSQRCVGQ